MDMNKILQEAIERFPIGTIFNSTGGYSNAIIHTNRFYFKHHCMDLMIDVERSPGCSTTDVTIKNGDGDKRWAKIVSTPEPVVINNYLIF